jgi:hypothetical protein
VTVFAGTNEGPIFQNDLQCDRVSLTKIRSIRGHMCSMIDFNLEAIAKGAPTVSFIHDYPGFVDTGIFEKTEGTLAATIRGALKIVKLFRSNDAKYIPIEECGDRHLFLATSARYKPPNNEICGIALDSEDTEVRGSYGSVGGGVYIVDENMESAGSEVEELLRKMREDGLGEKVWQHTQSEFKRICG